MRRVLVDANVLAEFFAGDPDTVEAFQRSQQLAINTVVLGELLAGFAAGARAEANRRLLSRFLAASRVTLLSLGAETAEHYADIYAGLAPQGQTDPGERHVDRRQRPGARPHGAHRDSHFRQVDGLLVGSSARAAAAD